MSRFSVETKSYLKMNKTELLKQKFQGIATPGWLLLSLTGTASDL